MSNGVVFRSQLASIMEVLANAAVEEICKIVDDGYAILHLEMSEYQKENESLKMKLHMMELKVAQGCTDGISMPESSLTAGFDGLRDHPRGASKERAVPAANRVFGHSAGGNLSNPLSVLGEDISLQPVIVKQDESADLEEGKTVLIKEEKPEEDNGALSVLKISDEALLTGAGGPGAGGEEWVAAANPGIASSQRTEDPTTQRRSRHGAWEVSGLDTALRSDPVSETAQKRLRRTGSERVAGGLSDGGSERVPCEVPGHPWAPVRAGAEDGTGALSCSPGRGDAEGMSVHSELQSLSAHHSAPSASLSSLGSAHLSPDVVVTDSIKTVPQCLKTESPVHSVWDKKTVSDRGQTQCRRYMEGGEREHVQPGHVTAARLPHTQPVVGEIAAVPSRSDATGSYGPVHHKKSFPTGRGFMTSSDGARARRFICKYCGKGFTRQNALEIHQRVHTGEKPFRCTQCGKRFSDSSNHRRHQSVHSRERPFSCTQCERSFSHQYQLKVHQRVHTGDRPFSCTHCGKKFGERSFLKIHQQREHAVLYIV